jgi:hypothetical protein
MFNSPTLLRLSGLFFRRTCGRPNLAGPNAFLSKANVAILAFALLTSVGCSQQDGAPVPENAANAGQSAPSDAPKVATAAGEPPAKPAAPVVEDQGPLNLIDLSTFERLPEAGNPLMKSATMIMYAAPGDPIEAYRSLKKKLEAQRWREQPGANIYPEYGSAGGFFLHHGYLLSLSTSKDDKGTQVTLIHQGDLDWKSVPLPADAKLEYAVASTAGYVTESSVDDTVAATKKAFADAGWATYGESPGLFHFKKGRQKLGVSISAAPAKGGKTMIQVNPMLLAVDLPLPPETIDARYHDAPAQLTFAHSGSWDDVAKFYQAELPKLGWTATTENLVKNEKDAFQIYRNPEKAFLELKLETYDGKTSAKVEYKSPGQFEDDEKRFKEFMEKKKAEDAKAATSDK